MSADKNKYDIATDLVHLGERSATSPGQPTSTPIYASSTYTYESMAEMDKVFGGELPGYTYTRYGNPTRRPWRKQFAELKAAQLPALTRREWPRCTRLSLLAS